MRLFIFASSVALSLPACKGDLPEEKAKPAQPVEKKSNVVKLETAVPLGKKVDCTSVLPDVAPFTAGIGDEIGSIVDKQNSNAEATFVCSIIRAGEPPETPKELKTLEEKYAKVGVLPGDEYCMVTGYCSLANDMDTFKTKCETDGSSLEAFGAGFACVRATEKGPDYNYTYKFIEPDTKCVVETMAGPSVVDQELVKNCALAAQDSITKAGVADFH